MQKVSENETMNEQCHGQIEVLHGDWFAQLELFQTVGVVSVVSGSDRWSLPLSREKGVGILIVSIKRKPSGWKISVSA